MEWTRRIQTKGRQGAREHAWVRTDHMLLCFVYFFFLIRSENRDSCIHAPCLLFTCTRTHTHTHTYTHKYIYTRTKCCLNACMHVLTIWVCLWRELGRCVKEQKQLNSFATNLFLLWFRNGVVTLAFRPHLFFLPSLFTFFYRLNLVILRPAVVYGIGSMAGLSTWLLCMKFSQPQLCFFVVVDRWTWPVLGQLLLFVVQFHLIWHSNSFYLNFFPF